MYAQGGHYPDERDPHQDAELRHQVRRNSHHASIALYDGCNECGGGGNYASFVMTIIAQEDPSRPIWPSCPSNGWISGVDRLTSLPNGVLPLVPKPSDWAPAPLDSNPNCTFIDSLDFSGYYAMTGVSSADECCAACSADAQCWAAALSPLGSQLVCWKKNETQAQHPFYSTGVS